MCHTHYQFWAQLPQHPGMPDHMRTSNFLGKGVIFQHQSWAQDMKKERVFFHFSPEKIKKRGFVQVNGTILWTCWIFSSPWLQFHLIDPFSLTGYTLFTSPAFKSNSDVLFITPWVICGTFRSNRNSIVSEPADALSVSCPVILLTEYVCFILLYPKNGGSLFLVSPDIGYDIFIKPVKRG